MTDRAAHLEWVPFHTAPGVSEATLIAAAEQLHREFLALQPGYIRRSLLRDAEGGFVDCVAWRSAADHASAMTASMDHPAAQPFFACLANPEADGADMHHFHVVQDWT
jgi:hypothetical protein